jgi:hypothetical protein
MADSTRKSTAGSAVFFRGHLLSKFSVFAEFVLYLPAATEFGVTFQQSLLMVALLKD